MGSAETERAAVVAYIRRCADAFAGVPLEAQQAGQDAQAAAWYSFDAILRYRNVADRIESGEHVGDEAAQETEPVTNAGKAIPLNPSRRAGLIDAVGRILREDEVCNGRVTRGSIEEIVDLIGGQRQAP